jgi:hypothetical protein
MKQRCYNPNILGYKNYGGRGIKVCDKWFDFNKFKEDMEKTYKKGLTLERIDNDGNYCKENCKWATRNEQANNKRNNKIIKNKTFSQWAEIIRINRGTLRSRYYRGMSIKEILQKGLFRPWKLIS